jgi:hypothetical protein
MNTSSEWNALQADNQQPDSDNNTLKPEGPCDTLVRVRTKAMSKPIIIRNPVTVRVSADRTDN